MLHCGMCRMCTRSASSERKQDDKIFHWEKNAVFPMKTVKFDSGKLWKRQQLTRNKFFFIFFLPRAADISMVLKITLPSKTCFCGGKKKHQNQRT